MSTNAQGNAITIEQISTPLIQLQSQSPSQPINSMPLKNKLKVINMHGGPCSGKTVAAKMLYAAMKVKGYSVEFSPEVAKKYVYEKNQSALDNQALLLGEQLQNLLVLEGQVEYAVTDSPLLLTILYNKYMPRVPFNDLVFNILKRFDTLDFFINRGHGFQQEGRIHNLEESKKIDDENKMLLKQCNPGFIEIQGQETTTPMDTAQLMIAHIQAWDRAFHSMEDSGIILQ
jgi:hypothetical protein